MAERFADNEDASSTSTALCNAMKTAKEWDYFNGIGSYLTEIWCANEGNTCFKPKGQPQIARISRVILEEMSKVFGRLARFIG